MAETGIRAATPSRGPGQGDGRARLLAFHGGDVLTLDPARPRATALLALGDRILAVGDDATVRALYQEYRGRSGAGEAESVALGRRALLPGLIDSHLHLLWYGFFLQQVDLNGTKSIGELQQRVRARAAATPAGSWITGGGWAQDFLPEKRMPNRSDLDAAAPDHPVLLHRVCYHAAVANSLALRLAGLTAATQAPPGGLIDRDAAGEPTGLLREAAVGLVSRAIPEPTPEQQVEALRGALRRAAAAGLTSVHTNDGPGQALRVYLALRDAGELTLRTYFDATYDGEDETALGLPGGLGDEWVRVGAVKMFTDGSLGARTAALRAPYTDEPSTSGLPVRPPEKLKDMIWRAHSRGRQVAVHAIGDLAVEIALDGIEAALRREPRVDHRHRIVHAQILAPDLVPRLARLGVVVDIQPKFTTGEMSWAPARVGPERERWSYCWKTMLDAGVRCAGGSDCPVEPLEPLYGIYAAVTRSDMEARVPGGWRPQERLDVETALRLFTTMAAYGAFEESVKGSLVPGKLADLVVLDRAPDRVRPHEIKDLKVEMTVVGGRPVHRAGGL